MECVNKILISRTPPLPPIKVPCGQCIACRLNRASDWATRIMHEKKMSGSSAFVTLTYDEEHLPYSGDYATLVKKDVQLFLKRVRKEIAPDKVRYYLCGEYGDIGKRPHYHLVMFGLSPVRAREVAQNCWRYGFVHVGDVSYDSAAYVARYCTKLLTGPKKEWYTERNILPEFSLMSRRPGIGASWLEKYGNEVKTHHNVVVKGRLTTPPRYYRDKVYEESDRCIVRDSVIDRVVAKIKEELEYDKTHEGATYQDLVQETRERTIKSRFEMKKRSKC